MHAYAFTRTKRKGHLNKKNIEKYLVDNYHSTIGAGHCDPIVYFVTCKNEMSESERAELAEMIENAPISKIQDIRGIPHSGN